MLLFTLFRILAAAISTFGAFKSVLLAIQWLTPKQQPPSPQDLQAPPTIAQGMPIMIAAGRQRQEKSHCVDWGDVQSHPIRAKGGKKG